MVDGAWLYERVALWVVLVLSLTVHEFAHAWQADRLGDDTARLAGRMTLDPLAHLDPLGSVALPLLGVPFGWAKPVPVEPRRFRSDVSMRVGMLYAALAGPLSNLLLAALAAVLRAALGGWLGGAGWHFLTTLMHVNLALAVFNLLPIPPLDGSRIVEGLMPASFKPGWERVRRAAPLALIVLAAIAFALWRAFSG